MEETMMNINDLTPQEKKCTKCEIYKSTESFYTDRSKLSGLTSNCIDCIRKSKQIYYWHGGGKEKILAYQKTSEGKQVQMRYASSIKGKENSKERSQRYSQRWPEKSKAHHAVTNAVASGKLLPVSQFRCLRCGDWAEARHHYLGYQEKHWFDFVDLCDPCHRRVDDGLR